MGVGPGGGGHWRPWSQHFALELSQMKKQALTLNKAGTLASCTLPTL